MDERFDEVLEEADVLDELDAPRAEVWASGLVAEWDDLDDLVARLTGSSHALAAAIACALVPMVPAARAVVDAAVARGEALPEWSPHVGTAAAQLAWEIVDPFSGNVSVVVEYEHDDGSRHSMLVEIEEGAAVDVHFGPPGLVDAAFDESDTRALSVREIEVPDALARALAAFARTDELARTDDADVTDELLMNRPLALVRLGAPVRARIDAPAPSEERVRTRPPRDADERDGDAAASVTLRAALAKVLAAPAPAGEPADTAGRVRAVLDARTDADLAALATDVDLGDHATLDDTTLLARLAGAFVVPGALAAFAPSEREALRSLEWADWLGAVIPLVRGGAGAAADPMQLVQNINRCPEVTTTVPRRDMPAVADVFARTLHAWELTGVLDDDGRLTALGAWLLPRALLDAWRPRA